MSIFLLSLLILTAPGCAYHWGLSQRSLPGGYTQLDVPIFKNKSSEVGIEPLFTNALIRRFERSQVAHVTDKNTAPVTLEGSITNVLYTAGAPQSQQSQGLANLPTDAVLANFYTVSVWATVILRRKSDERIVWQGSFHDDKVYQAPQMGTAVVNSANATYNQSARIHTISLMAEEMMDEAHDRITENY